MAIYKIDAVKTSFRILVQQNLASCLQEGLKICSTDIEANFKTRQFTGNFKFFIYSLFPSGIGKWRRKKLADELYYERGLQKIDSCLDVVTLLKTQKRLKVLEKALFNSRQLVLSKMSRWNYLSENTSTEDNEYPDPKILD